MIDGPYDLLPPDDGGVTIATLSADHLIAEYYSLIEVITHERQRIAELIMRLDVPLSAVTVQSKATQEALRQQWQRLSELVPVR